MSKRGKDFRKFFKKNDLTKRQKAIGLILTEKCNANCDFCVWKYTNNMFHNPRKEIDFEVIKKVLIEAKELNYDFVALTGGETCLYSRFEDLIKLLCDLKLEYSFVSNAKEWEKYKIIFENEYHMKFFQSCAVSLDCVNHGILGRNVPLEKVKEFSKYLNEKKAKFSIKMAVGKHNYTQIMDVMNLCEELKPSKFEAFSMILANDYLLNASHYKEIYKMIDKNKKYLTKSLEKFDISFSMFEMDKLEFCHHMGDRNIELYPNNKFYYCCGMFFDEFLLGDAREDDITTILRRKKEKTQIIMKNWIELYCHENTMACQMKDKCSACRWALSCKKDDGGVRVLNPGCFKQN